MLFLVKCSFWQILFPVTIAIRVNYLTVRSLTKILLVTFDIVLLVVLVVLVVLVANVNYLQT